MLGIDAPELFPNTLRFQMPIGATGELGPVKRQALRHKRCRKVGSIREQTRRHDTLIACVIGQDCLYALALAKGDQGELGLLSVRLIEFRSVDPSKPDVGAVNDNRVAIDDMTPACLTSAPMEQIRPIA